MNEDHDGTVVKSSRLQKDDCDQIEKIYGSVHTFTNRSWGLHIKRPYIIVTMSVVMGSVLMTGMALMLFYFFPSPKIINIVLGVVLCVNGCAVTFIILMVRRW